jgi:hypothetical protein
VSFHLRMSRRIGSRYLHVRPNLSLKGVSWTVKIGPWSWNTRQRQHRIDGPGPTFWTSKRRRRTP